MTIISLLLALLAPFHPGYKGYKPQCCSAERSSGRPPIIVVGFVGGFISHDNSVHSTVQLGAKLRRDFPSGVYSQVFENHRGEAAHRELLSLLDTNGDGTLSPQEKRNARIILYGHSWGGSQAITLASALEKEEIPVELTIQVDSVTKHGENDGTIPANVASAANFYQNEGLLHGRAEIHAADPTHTKIVGNYKSSYQANPIPCPGYPWYARFLTRAHVEIECDPRVWDQVETLIRARIVADLRPDQSDR